MSTLYGSVLDKRDAAKYLLEHTPEYNSSYYDLYTGQNAALNAVAGQELAQLGALNKQYANALQNQYLSNRNMYDAIVGSAYGTGAKEALLEQNKKDIQSAYAAYQQNYLSNKSDIVAAAAESAANVQSQYGNALSDLTDTLSTGAEYYSKLPTELYNYMTWLNENYADTLGEDFSRFYDSEGNLLSWLDLSRGQSPDKYYTQGGTKYQYESMIDSQGNLTDYGRDIYNQLLSYDYEGNKSFGAYLSENNPKLAEWLSQTDSSGETYYDKFLRYGDFAKGLDGYNAGDYKRLLYKGALGSNDTRTTASVSDVTPYSAMVTNQGNFKITSENQSMFSYYDDAGLSKNKIPFVDKDVHIYGNKEGYDPATFKKKAAELTKGQTGFSKYEWLNSAGSRDLTIHKVGDAALNGELPDNTIVDVNRGRGVDYYIYTGGKFYKLWVPRK